MKKLEKLFLRWRKGKASSDDMIANELLKSLNYENTLLLTDLFNICLEKGVYPWNKNIITPLHKKGCKYNPDNYRAISVSSGIGKLLSTILLDRFINLDKDHDQTRSTS